MLIISLIIIIISIVAIFFIGISINRWDSLVSTLSIIAVIFSTIFGITLFYVGVEKDTLINYDNGRVNYKVINVDVEHNKTVDIRVIYNRQKDKK